MLRFNVTEPCVPEKDYMVDISGKLEQIIELIDRGSYLTINRARKYGKTTTLACLKNAILDKYVVASISFEGVDDESFTSSEAFCTMFLEKIAKALSFTSVSEQYTKEWVNNEVTDFFLLGEHITKMCKDHKVVLVIDNIEETGDNRILIHFLGVLRSKFMSARSEKDYTFHSVILVGVHDIKNIKVKMKYPGAAEENIIHNAPWNIASDFNVDMSFNPIEIATMLSEYEADHNAGMDIMAISDEIYRFTGGYPFLVSRICQAIDEELGKDWTIGGVHRSVKMILMEQNTLFEDLFKNIKNNKKLADFLYDLLFIGIEKSFSIYNSLVNLGCVYGFFKESNGKVKVANAIFATLIYNYFVSENEDNKEIAKITGVLQQDVVRNGRFNMELCLLKFAEYYAEIFGGCDLKFIEKQGRLLFLLYLQPLINGQGFYHIESQFTDLRRMDIVVDFDCDQFIIELKLWHGNSLHQEAYEQLLGYMESKKALNGYLLTFDFRKKANKQLHAEWVDFDGGKRIFDVVL